MNLKAISKEVVSENDSKDFQYVDESSLNRLLTKHYKDGFIIITSYRNENDDTANKKSFEELKRTVRDNKYSFIPVWGAFIEDAETPDAREVKEPALIIPNHKVASTAPYPEDNLKELGIDLCKKYNQDSFLYKPAASTDKAYYIDKSGKVVTTFTNKTINYLTQIYFTKLFNTKSTKGDFSGKTDKRFTFTEQLYLNKSPRAMNEAIKRYGEHFFNLNNVGYIPPSH
jgi:hypothetical protein